jgi:probable HAF family extracellular repeat protein
VSPAASGPALADTGAALADAPPLMETSMRHGVFSPSRPTLGASLILAAAGAACAQPQYRVVLIDPVPGTTPGLLHSPVAVNDAGEVAGYFADASAQFGYHTFFWRPGQGSIDIGTPPGLPLVLPRDINNTGKIVGEAAADANASATQPRPFSWEAGQIQTYPPLVGGRPANVGLTNDAGRVIGWANDGSFIGKFAVEYTPSGPVRLLPNVQGYNDAVDVNNQNIVLGTNIDGAYMLSPDGSIFILPAPGANLGATVNALNDRRDVGGSVRETGHPEGSTAAVWLSDSGWAFIPPGARRNVVTSINAQREAVGNSRDNAGAIGDHGFYWSPQTGRHALQDLIVDPPGVYAVWIASDISETGIIAATVANRATGQSHGAVLVPAGGAGCYANCDGSTPAPVLNVLDFNCFLNRFSAGEAYANCDGSTAQPALNVLDFNCFLNRFTAGCP